MLHMCVRRCAIIIGVDVGCGREEGRKEGRRLGGGGGEREGGMGIFFR
jgi:hypothetical protein